MKIITDLIPKGIQGMEVDFYYRDLQKQKSTHERRNEPHLIPTWALFKNEYDAITSTIARKVIGDRRALQTTDSMLKKLGVKLQVIPFERDEIDLNKHTEDDVKWMEQNRKFVIWAKGPKEMKHYLPKPFITGSKNDARNNVRRMLEWRKNFPFVNFEDKTEHSSLEDLLSQRKCALDLEVRGWQKNQDEIFQCAFITNDPKFGNRIITTDEMGTRELMVDTYFGNYKIDVVKAKNEKNLGEILTDFFQELDPLYVFIHNAGYDLRQLRDLTKVFFPGVNAEKPKQSGTCGFYGRWTIPGRYVIDTAPLAQNWLWTPNNKLITVGNYTFNADMEKDIQSYEELEEWGELSKTDTEFTKKSGLYNVRDTVLHFELGNNYLREILLIGKMLRQEPTKVIVTSKKNLGLQEHERQQVKRLHTHGFRLFGSQEKLDEFNMDELKNSLIKLPKKATTGTYDATVLYLTPFIKGLKQIIDADSEAKVCYEEMNATRNPIHKIVLAQGLNAYLLKAVYDLEGMSPTSLKETMHHSHTVKNVADWTFGKIFGIKNGEYASSKNVQTLNNRVYMANYTLRRYLEQEKVLNHSPRFVLLEGNADISDLEDIAIKLGSGTSLSMSKNRFAVNLDGQIISQGIDVYGRKGDKNAFEERVITELFKLMLIEQDPQRVKQYVAENIEYLMNGDETKLKEELVLVNVARREWFQYRDKAHMIAKVKYQIRKGIRQGQEISRGFILEKDEEVDYKEMLEGTLDRNHYYERMFGKKGTVRNVIRAYFKDEKQFMKSISTGQTTLKL